MNRHRYIRATHETEDSETGAVTSCTETRIHYTYLAGCAAQVYGPAERCHPAEAAEVELDYVEREQEGRWVRLDLSRAEAASPESMHDHALQVWAEYYLAEHTDEVTEREADLAAEAREYAAECRADR